MLVADVRPKWAQVMVPAVVRLRLEPAAVIASVTLPVGDGAVLGAEPKSRPVSRRQRPEMKTRNFTKGMADGSS